MSKRKHITGKVVAGGALLAAGVGYLAGILTAPKSGEETRKDVAKTVTKSRSDAEKQIKKLHSELHDLITEADKSSQDARTKAGKELKEATKLAQEAKEKAREMLTALHDGDVKDPNLHAVVDEIKLAKDNLVKFIKK